MAPRKTQNQNQSEAAHSFRFRVPAGDDTVLAFMEAQGRTEKNEALSLLVHLFVAQHGVVRVKDLLYKSYLEMVNRQDSGGASAMAALSAQELQRDAAVSREPRGSAAMHARVEGAQAQHAGPAALADGVVLPGAPDELDGPDEDFYEEPEPRPRAAQPAQRQSRNPEPRRQAAPPQQVEPEDDMSNDFFGRPR